MFKKLLLLTITIFIFSCNGTLDSKHACIEKRYYAVIYTGTLEYYILSPKPDLDPICY